MIENLWMLVSGIGIVFILIVVGNDWFRKKGGKND